VRPRGVQVIEDVSATQGDPDSVDELGSQSLTHGTRSAAVFEIIGYVLTIAIRLGSNLILTRLLMPEAFGLMAMLNALQFVLWMLSEVGLSQAVVMSPRGDDQKFLDTVFSLQAIRGVILWLGAAALAYPTSLFFKAPDLVWIVPIGSAATLFHGFASTRVYTLRRRVRPLPILTLELASSTVALIINVTGAMLGFGVKVLVISLVVHGICFAAGSHFLPGASYRNHLRTDPESRAEILHFGRWIFFSSILTAVAARGDQLLLGRLIGAAGLGIYNIALALAEMPEALLGRVIDGAIYPTMARVYNTEPGLFGTIYYRMRLWMDPLAHVGLGLLIGLSDWIIALLYDDRYLTAGPFLRILALRTALQMVVHFCETCFVAQGASQFSFRRNLFVSVMLLIAMPIGSALGGVEGVLWGSVVAKSTALFALWPEARRRGFLRLSREVLAIPYLAAGYAIGWALTQVLPKF